MFHALPELLRAKLVKNKHTLYRLFTAPASAYTVGARAESARLSFPFEKFNSDICKSKMDLRKADFMQWDRHFSLLNSSGMGPESQSETPSDPKPQKPASTTLSQARNL